MNRSSEGSGEVGSRPLGWSEAVGGVLPLIGFTLILGFAYKSISGGAFPVAILGCIFGFGALLVLIARRGRLAVPGGLPEPIASELRATLDGDRLHRVELRYADQGPASTFPRPMAHGRIVTIPRRVLSEFSSEALTWSVRTDALASVTFTRRIGGFLVGGDILLLGAMAVAERYHLQSRLLPLFGIGVVLIVAAAVLGTYRTQLWADRQVTRTEKDKAAAHEALSIPYRAQQAKSTSEKWTFSVRELRGRARALGIDLDAP